VTILDLKKIPPYEETAEAAIVAEILQGEATLDALGLSADAFYEERHRLVIEAAAALRERGAPVDPLGVEAEVERTIQPARAARVVAVLRDIVDRFPTGSRQAAYYAGVVKDHARRRAALVELDRTAARLHTDRTASVEAVVQAGRDALQAVAAPTSPASAPPRRILPAFPIDVFPEPLRGLIEAAAAGFEAPVELAALPAMAVLGAALGPRWVCGPRGLLRPPAVWLVVTAPSGSGKTPVGRPLVEPIVLLDRQLREAFEHALEGWKTRESARRGRKGAQADGDGAPQPVRRRLIVTDTTPEGLLVELAKAEGHGLLLHTDELGTLLGSMDGYKATSGRAGRSTWLSLWSGTPVRSVRKVADGAEVDRPFVAVLGGVQASVLRSMELADGDGLCARFMWAHVTPRVGGLGRGMNETIASTWRRAVELATRHAADGPQLLDEDAAPAFDALVRESRERAIDMDEAGKGLASSFHGKAGDVVARLVALLHGFDAVAEAIEGPAPDLTRIGGRGVPATTLERAIRLAGYFLAHGLETARLVTSRAPREGDAETDEDAAFLNGVLAIVRPGESVLDTSTGWRALLDRVGVRVESPDAVGRRMSRASAAPPGGVSIRPAPTGERKKGRGWEVRRAAAEGQP
jgi:hypothetical protein